MYNIKTLNNIADSGLKYLKKNEFTIDEVEENINGILLRSADMHEYPLDDELLAIARAGAGTNNIPIDKCTEKGIAVFNTPGANANAVKELVLTGILLSSRKVIEGIEWSKSLRGKENIPQLVEKGKKQFAGPEIKGKTIGVVGLGAIGVLVANAAIALGMEVKGFDPYLSVQSALTMNSNIYLSETLESMVSKCDYVTLHLPLNTHTRAMINDEIFSQMKEGTKLLNFARGGLVDNDALKRAFESGIIDKYITDFPDEEILGLPNIIAIPHLGASTPESEENCAEMAAIELKAYLKYGTIKNSVNFPDCESLYTGKARISVIHKNIPNMLGLISSVFARENLNIDNMVNKSKGDIAYTLVDLDSLDGKSEELVRELNSVNGVIKTRIVRASTILNS